MSIHDNSLITDEWRNPVTERDFPENGPELSTADIGHMDKNISFVNNNNGFDTRSHHHQHHKCHFYQKFVTSLWLNWFTLSLLTANIPFILLADSRPELLLSVYIYSFKPNVKQIKWLRGVTQKRIKWPQYEHKVIAVKCQMCWT